MRERTTTTLPNRETTLTVLLCRLLLLPVLFAAGVTLPACGESTLEPTIPLGTPVSLSTQTPVATVIMDTSGASSGAGAAGGILVSTGGTIGSQAPEFAGISSWINSDPLTLADLRGEVVLVDFWTYTCVNCVRTFPYLKEWNEKYADLGLTIVGVHSPEFEFEEVRENVVRSSEDHGLIYPIAQDNDFDTWRAYKNLAWPSKYLIDAAGIVRYAHFGEGGYVETERQIRQLLSDIGADVTRVNVGTDPGPSMDFRARSIDQELRLTSEIYAGFERNLFSGPYIEQGNYFLGPDEVRTYEDPGAHFNNFLYLQGDWLNSKEYLVHGRETRAYEDYVALKASAISVNVVIDPEVAESFDVQVTIDGRPLRQNEAGFDIIVEDARSFFVVNEARMYRILELPAYGTHELKLSSNSTGFAIFAFTFGGYPEGP